MKKTIKYLYLVLISLFIGIIPTKAEITGITLHKNQILLGVGYSENIKYSISDGLNSSSIIWTSTNEKVAIVQNGKVTAITEGSAIITASINGKKATCKIIVSSDYVPVKGINLNKNNLNILIGTTETLIEEINPTNATNKDVIWTSSDTSVAIVENGRITAKKLGTAIITVSSFGYNATCKVTVVDAIKLKNITINQKNITLKEKESTNLSVTFNPNNATNKMITWKSSNTNIVTVDSQGRVTAQAPGSATITVVSNDGGYVDTCQVNVEAISKKVTDVSLDKKEITLIIGEKTTINATINPDYAENKNVSWTSSDKNIATVENGEITAISKGQTEIKVITEDGNKEATCILTVLTPPVKNITFNETEKTVFIESVTKLIPILEPIQSTLENAIWTSSDERIATVENGVVKALSLGETTITVANEDNTVTTSIKIKIINKPKEKLNITIEGYNLNFNPEVKNYTLEIGNIEKLTINTNVSEDKVKINGNQNLKNGSIITINVTDEEKVTYVINIKKKENYTIYFIAIISVLLLLNLVRIVVKNKKKK